MGGKMNCPVYPSLSAVYLCSSTNSVHLHLPAMDLYYTADDLIELSFLGRAISEVWSIIMSQSHLKCSPGMLA